MKSKGSFFIVILISSCFHLFGGDTNLVSESHEDDGFQQFVDKVKSSIYNSNNNAQSILDLYCWDNVDADIKSQVSNTISFFYKQGISDVQFVPVTPDFQNIQYSKDAKYEYNLSVIGLIKFQLKQGQAVKIPIGKKDGEIVFVSQHRLKEPTAGTAQNKFIGIRVSGNDLDGGKSVLLQCSYTYTADGKEMSEKITGKDNISKSFWGDSITRCEVDSSDTNTTLDLDLTIDGASIYSESAENTNKLVYIGK
jgi:hypothetical protein